MLSIVSIGTLCFCTPEEYAVNYYLHPPKVISSLLVVISCQFIYGRILPVDSVIDSYEVLITGICKSVFLLCAQLLSFYCHTEVEKKVRVGCEGNAKRQWIAVMEKVSVMTRYTFNTFLWIAYLRVGHGSV